MINGSLKVTKVLYVFNRLWQNSEEEFLFLYLIHPGNKVFWHSLTQTGVLSLLCHLTRLVEVLQSLSIGFALDWSSNLWVHEPVSPGSNVAKSRLCFSVLDAAHLDQKCGLLQKQNQPQRFLEMNCRDASCTAEINVTFPFWR